MTRLAVALLSMAVLAFGAGEPSKRRAPGFALYDTNMKSHDPLDYRGKVLIVEFMQVGCPHCVTFSAILEQVKAKYKDRVAVLSVVNPPSDANGVKQYIKVNRVANPILFDCGQVAFSYLQPKSGSIAIPHVFLIDAQGVIQYDVGYTDANKEIFEGKEFFPIVDKMFAAPAPARKK